MNGITPLQRQTGQSLTSVDDTIAVSLTTPAGQAAPVVVPLPDLDLGGTGQAFLDVRPTLDQARTQGLLSSDEAIQALLDNPDTDLETLILAQMALNNKQLDQLNESKAKDIEANRKKSEANQAERMERLKEANSKIESANKKSWWSKALGVVASVAGLVAGIMAAPFTGGLSLAVAVYALVNTAYDLVNELNVAINGEDARWQAKPFSIGYWVGEIAQKLGASPEVAAMISAAVEVVIGLAALAAGSTSAINSGMSAAAKVMQASASGLSATARLTSGALTISTEVTKYQLAGITAKMDTLQAQIDRLMQSNQQLMTMLKNIQQARQDNDDTVTDTLESFRETTRRITMA